MIKYNRDVLFCLLMLMLNAVLWLEMSSYSKDSLLDYGFDPVFFPRILLIIWAVLCVALTLRARRVVDATENGLRGRRMLISMTIVIVYVLLMSVAGFIASSVLFMAIFAIFVGDVRRVPAITAAFLFPLGLWYLFSQVVSIAPPSPAPWILALFSGATS